MRVMVVVANVGPSFQLIETPSDPAMRRDRGGCCVLLGPLPLAFGIVAAPGWDLAPRVTNLFPFGAAEERAAFLFGDLFHNGATVSKPLEGRFVTLKETSFLLGATGQNRC